MSAKLNYLLIEGRAGGDPELREYNGKPVASFSLGCEHPWMKKDNKPETFWVKVSAWGKTAEFVSNYVRKGNRVRVQGTPRASAYIDKSGEAKASLDCRADSVEIIDWPKSLGKPEGKAQDDDDLPF